jgi:hypothetical protein
VKPEDIVSSGLSPFIIGNIKDLNITMKENTYGMNTTPTPISPPKSPGDVYNIDNKQPILTTTIRNSLKNPKDITEMDLIAEKLEKKNNESTEKTKNYEVTEENYLLKNIPNKGFLMGTKGIGREKALKGNTTVFMIDVCTWTDNHGRTI